MKQYGLLGSKLEHSYSAKIHNYVFRKYKVAAVYNLYECKEDELASYILSLKKGIYAGFNVTIPYKKTIMQYLDKVDEKALAIGSVNTIYLQDGLAIGTNTDYDGFYATLKKYNIEVANKNCYVLGTGGASLAVIKVLNDLGGKVYSVSRNPFGESIGYNDLENRDIDILVNTTPVGMYPNVNETPVTLEIAQKAKVVIDIIFNPRPTYLLKMANSNYDGLYMLIVQALKALELWLKQFINISIEEIIEEL